MNRSLKATKAKIGKLHLASLALVLKPSQLQNRPCITLKNMYYLTMATSFCSILLQEGLGLFVFGAANSIFAV